MRIDPWSSQQYADYARLREHFGIAPFTQASELPDPIPLLERGVVFGQRGFDRITRAVQRHEPWALLTGLMPSGPMHVGHKMLIDQITYWQKLGAEVFIAIADIEAYATRGFSLAKARQVALDHYVTNYLALGLDPQRCQIYFQSQRQPVKDLAWQLGKKVTWSTMEGIYGFTGATNLGHVQAPLVQVGDILHVQQPKYGGPRPTLVPVGVDQDPHLRLTRDLAEAFRVFSIQPVEKGKDSPGGLGIFLKTEAKALPQLAERLAPERPEFAKALAKHDEGERDVAIGTALLKLAKHQLKVVGFGEFHENFAYRALYLPAAGGDDVPVVDAALAALEQQALGEPGFLLPSSTYHRFMSGLTGDKMSSSRPETSIYLTEEPEAARKKVMAAKTGGRPTAEEQRRLGGEWDKCVVAELYLYHLAPDASDLKEKYDACVTGARLCGPCKGIAADRTVAFLQEHAERRKQVGPAELRAFVRED
ncbi:MAG: tryptophan--tRNA ligase [Halobacteriales archaeon]|nr:tryptophan--tRNA ligase [Halobacteriales archaeon]